MFVRILLIIPLLLLSISIWTLSSLENNLNWSNPEVWLTSRSVKQLLFGAVSLVVSVLFVHYFKIQQKFKSIFWFNLIVSIINLSVIIVDLEIRGASRWLKFGLFSLQPSELAKVGLVIWVAYFATFRDLRKTKDLLWFWSLPIFSFLTIWNPSFGQSDLGTASIVVLPAVVVFMVHPTISRLYKSILTMGCILVLVFLSFNLANYQKQRLDISNFVFRTEAWLPANSDDINRVCNQTTLYNTCQSISLVANNQLFGSLESYQTNRTLFLPERQTDFIFASISHYLGIFGSFAVLLLYLIFSITLIRLLSASQGYQSYLVLAGSVTIFSQIIINIGMNLGLFPVVGVPLPWLSYGGSHTLGAFLLLFIMINQERNKFQDI